MEAAGTVRDLIERECVVCGELADVLHAERDALTSFSVNAVSDCVRRKGVLHAQLVSLVQRRRDAVRELGRELGVEADDGRVTPLLPHMPAGLASELRGAVAGLRGTLMRTRHLQRVNGALIDASLRAVGELVGVYRRFLPGTRYDGRATVTPGLTPDALDQRA